MRREAIEPDYTIRSVERALQLLKLFRPGREELSFPEICAGCGLNKSTVYRLLVTLEKHGFVALNSEGKYYPGSVFVDLSTLVNVQQHVRNKARAVLDNLTRISGETVILTLLNANTLNCIDKIESANTLTITSQIGAVVPLFHGATGRSISAFFTDKQLEHYRLQEGRRLNCVYEKDDLVRINREVAQQGYCVSDSEVDAAVVALAAPFWGSQRQILGSISIAGPNVRFDPQAARRYAQHLLDATAALSSQFEHETSM